ncbi:unnamed protein product, partial [Cyprideis torosa]
MSELDVSQMTSTERPLKLLCLHGYRQNGSMFREKTGAVRKLIGKKWAEFHFPTAPHPTPPLGEESAGAVDGRGWYFCRVNPPFFKSTEWSPEAYGLEESVDSLSAFVLANGPFDGVLGFSQGAALAAILAGMQENG